MNVLIEVMKRPLFEFGLNLLQSQKLFPYSRAFNKNGRAIFIFSNFPFKNIFPKLACAIARTKSFVKTFSAFPNQFSSSSLALIPGMLERHFFHPILYLFF